MNCNIYSAAGLKGGVCHEFCLKNSKAKAEMSYSLQCFLQHWWCWAGHQVWEMWILLFPGLPKLRCPEYRTWPGCIGNTKLTVEFCTNFYYKCVAFIVKDDRHAQVRTVCTGQRLFAIWRPGVLSTEESMFVGTKYFPPLFKSRGNILVIFSFFSFF